MSYLPSFLLYYIAVIILCVMAFRSAKNLADYLLGGRSLSASVTALGVGASDMSSWLLMALPGAAYMHYQTEVWMPIGLLIGAYINWRLVAVRLRVFTELAANSLTIPSFLGDRLVEHAKLIRILTAATILFFFTVYAAAGFKGGALVFATVFHIPPKTALFTCAAFIVLYTTIGGFLAISWVDLVQGILLFAAIVSIPLIMLNKMTPMQQAQLISQLHKSWLTSTAADGGALIGVSSLLAWGLGYFGQPHILVRFMAIKHVSDMAKSRRIHIFWMFFALLGALSVGIIGHFILTNQLLNPEAIFITVIQSQLIHWLAGLLFAIILSAIMSAISAQLLAASSAITADVVTHIRKRELSPKTLLMIGRITVFILGLAAISIAVTPHINIMHLVSYAWAGLGASFGPVIILSLYWRRLSSAGALAGILSAAIAVVTWKYCQISFGGVFKLYEIIPAFALNMCVCTIVSLLIPNKSNKAFELFSRMHGQLEVKSKL